MLWAAVPNKTLYQDYFETSLHERLDLQPLHNFVPSGLDILKKVWVVQKQD